MPGNSVDASFRGKPEQRAIYDAIVRYLETLGDIHADAVSVGVFLKSDRKLAELRPKSKWLECALYLPEVVDDARVARSMRLSSTRVVNFVKLRAADDVDAQVQAWLTDAFDLATD